MEYRKLLVCQIDVFGTAAASAETGACTLNASKRTFAPPTDAWRAKARFARVPANVQVCMGAPSDRDITKSVRKGQTPVVPVPGKRKSVSAVSAVTARGSFWFATYKKAMSAPLFIELLKKLMRHRKKPVYLILDSLPAHKSVAGEA